MVHDAYKTMMTASSTKVFNKSKSRRATIPVAGRTLLLGAKDQAEPFPSNAVKTSIYTAYNFVPKNLFKQFTRFSNIYFLFITALQLLPDVTSSSGVPTMIVPLFFIIVVSGVRDLFEDMQRHRADAQQNLAPMNKLHFPETQFAAATCADLRVGELVRVAQNEAIPADIVIVATSSSANGQCYVTTANLDGESSLKPRYAHPELCKMVHAVSFSQDGKRFDADVLNSLSGIKLECEAPNRRIDKFKGSVLFTTGQVAELDISHILLRGTHLKDTNWIIGSVIYTGDDTRVRQNSSETPVKLSWLYKFINKITLWVVLAQIVILVVAVLIEKHLVSSSSVQDNPYIPDDTKNAKTIDYIWLFLAYMLLFSNFVPISLQVTIDFTRYFQSLVIINDREMRVSSEGPSTFAGDFKVTDKRQVVRVQSSELNEELGMVEHIFTDKTGTLTCNRMEFRTCHVDGKTYGYHPTDGTLRQIDQSPRSPRSPRLEPATLSKNALVVHKSPQVHRFFINLAVNNSISPGVISASPSGGDSILEYSGPSPDERALVMAAARAGIELQRRDNAHIFLRVHGIEVEYEILHMFEFTSDRKKSSILCRERASEQLILFCKGADSVILASLSDHNHGGKVMQAKEQMQVYSSNGLRVLCIAERQIAEQDYRVWLEKYVAARNNANKEGTEEEVDRVVSELEQQLMLVGVSGIEDKIQEGAPECLEKFRAAGIKIWMLTGDRPDTATNVAYSVRLISSEMKLVKLIDNQLFESKTTAIQFLQKELQTAQNDSTRQPMALVLNDAAVEAIKTFGIEYDFLSLCMHCESVLCARISPKQKEFIVEMVRHFFPTKVTMAVGDGANDVPMIQRAHIGVGIAGEEGQQASDASDYSIPMFKHLQQLILVHGRWMNRRVSILTLYIFYKNVLLVLPQFVYGCYCLYSGQSTYYDTLLQLFNICFTSLPVLYFAVLDKDISAQTLVLYPKLYQDGFLHTFLNVKVFVYWMLEATITSILIILVPAKLIPLVPWSSQGKDNDLWSMGLAQNFTVVFLANMRLLVEVSSNHGIMLVLILASLSLWWIVVLFMSSYVSFGREFYGILRVGGVTGLFLCCVFCSITGLFSAFLPKVWNVFIVPNARTICREIDSMSAFRQMGSETVFPIDRDDAVSQDPALYPHTAK
ncbi:Phospholipid-translocating p-type flippase [Globisporangium polare]